MLGRAIIRPVIEEWPTIALLTLIFGSTINIWLNPITGNNMPVDLFLLHWCRNFTAAYFFVAVLCLFPRKLPRNCVRTLLITISSLLLLLENISYSIFDLHISIPLITLLSETNTHEISTTGSIVLKSYGFYTTLIRFAILISLFGVAQKYRKTINDKVHGVLHRNRPACCKSPRIVYATASTLLAAGLLSGTINLCSTLRFFKYTKAADCESFLGWYLSNDVDLLSRVSLVLKHLSLQREEFKQWEQSQLTFINNGIATSNASDSLKVAGIIGESFIFLHSSAYGYPLNTTPRIEAECQRGNMVAFTNIISYDYHTAQSIRSIMALNHKGDMSFWNKSIFFPLTFKKAGFEVNYYDNQHPSAQGFYDISLAEQVLNKIIVQNCYNDYYDKNTNIFDLDFINETNPTNAKPEHKELTIYHLRGSHL